MMAFLSPLTTRTAPPASAMGFIPGQQGGLSPVATPTATAATTPTATALPSFEGRLPSVDYRSLTTTQRIDLTKLSKEDLGYLHVGGRGLSFVGSREGIYHSYWTLRDKIRNNDASVSERDKAAVQQAANLETRFGLPSGLGFEVLYLHTLDKLTQNGQNAFLNKIWGQPIVRDTGKRLQTPDGLATDSTAFVNFQKSIGNTRANFSNMMMLTGWNHDPLDNAAIDGSIYPFELASIKENTALTPSPEAMAFSARLAENELADGLFNNSTGGFFAQAFDSTYLGTATPLTASQVIGDTQRQLASRGQSYAQLQSFVSRVIQQMRQG